MNRFISTLAAACFALSAASALAQGPSGDGKMGGGRHQMKPCSQEPDPAKCEANRKQMKENMKAAHDACKGKPDERACMAEQFCAKQPDPSKCREKAKEHQANKGKRMDEHQAAAEACTGKRGEELQKCYREQREKRGHK